MEETKKSDVESRIESRIHREIDALRFPRLVVDCYRVEVQHELQPVFGNSTWSQMGLRVQTNNRWTPVLMLVSTRYPFLPPAFFYTKKRQSKLLYTGEHHALISTLSHYVLEVCLDLMDVEVDEKEEEEEMVSTSDWLQRNIDQLREAELVMEGGCSVGVEVEQELQHTSTKWSQMGLRVQVNNVWTSVILIIPHEYPFRPPVFCFAKGPAARVVYGISNSPASGLVQHLLKVCNNLMTG